MRVIRSIKLMQKWALHALSQGQTIGFVPTMGALHEGHLSLIKQCRRENDFVVVSIFVNPKQFSINEDFSRYPRQERKDQSLAKKAQTDVLFCPSVEEMYPRDYLTVINIPRISEQLCGKSRPGHFQGVATVVLKLIHIVIPDILYLGQKDAQQVLVIRQMINDLNCPIKIKQCKTMRASDGLALSSRNSYLTETQRKEAVILFQSLNQSKKMILEGERDIKKMIHITSEAIQTKTSGRVDYIEFLDADTFKPLTNNFKNILITIAVYFGKTRLIDNIILRSR
jgi:pantoate--beta-alanine ligase